VVSTDPAHSLGDAFELTLDGRPKKLDDSIEGGELWAMEINPEEALSQFQDIVKGSVSSDSSNAAASGGFMSGLGLGQLKDDLVDMLSGVNDPPPGTDEIVALTRVMSFMENGYEIDGKRIKFDRIVLDTAPTGHTLRMLELPAFLIQFIRKLKNIRDKAGSLGGMMGSSANSANPMTNQDDRLERFEKQMERLQSIFVDSKESEFIVVTIPTDLAVAESQRLLTSLRDSRVSVRRVIVNQMIPAQKSSTDDGVANAYLNRIKRGQKMSIDKLTNLATSSKVDFIQVPYFDTEVRTVYGLRVLANSILSK
jgi:arsenite/tail-anchored protein-transporting ATPase